MLGLNLCVNVYETERDRSCKKSLSNSDCELSQMYVVRAVRLHVLPQTEFLLLLLLYRKVKNLYNLQW